MQVPRQGGEGGGDTGANAGEALPPVVRHSLAVDEPLLEAAKGDVDGEVADLRRVVHRRARGVRAAGGSRGRREGRGRSNASAAGRSRSGRRTRRDTRVSDG